LPVGQGDGALLEWSDGERWLIDAGPDSRNVRRYLKRRRIKRIDALILTHPHPDHSGGMKGLLPHFDIGSFWAPRPPEGDEVHYRSLWRQIKRMDIPVYGPEDKIGKESEIVHPVDDWRALGSDRVNEESLSLSVSYAGRRILLTGDIESQAEHHLQSILGRHDVLKVAHHGSKTSTSPSFLQSIVPEIALISCGKQNRYGHPHPETLRRLSGVSVFRTDRQGLLSVSISRAGRISVRARDGKQLYSLERVANSSE